MYSIVKLFVFAMNSRRPYSIFVCFIYGLEEKNSKSVVIFAVCRLKQDTQDMNVTNLVPRDRDPFGQHKKLRQALVTAVTLSTNVKKPLLNLNACVQSNWNQNFLVPGFDLLQSIGRSIPFDQNGTNFEDEIGTISEASEMRRRFTFL